MAQNESTEDSRTYPSGGAVRERSPVFNRNGPVITAHLSDLLAASIGDVLEIGSGTGQHVAAFAAALPDLTWWPTEVDPRRLPSIDAWRRHAGLANLRPTAVMDAARTPWQPDRTGVPLDQGLAAVIAVNVVHISPWAVTEGIVAGAGAHLKTGGYLVFYGPFLRDEVPTAPGNLSFDAQLRAQDPAWGLRQVSALETAADAHGLILARTVEVPANNLILEFHKPDEVA
jgi:SAM-dependent methyltransferase